MDEFNPYDSPEHSSRRAPRKRYEKPRDMWLGILGVAGGVGLLLVTLYFYVVTGAIWIWGLGGGCGILVVGAMRFWSYFEDKRYSRQVDDMIQE